MSCLSKEAQAFPGDPDVSAQCLLNIKQLAAVTTGCENVNKFQIRPRLTNILSLSLKVFLCILLIFVNNASSLASE